MKLRFAKMEGTGNDYVYVDCVIEPVERLGDLSALSKKISDRHFGIGSDGLILILPSKKADFRMRMFNADGSEGEMCGNGIRCFAKYVHDRKLTSKDTLTVETKGGIKELELFVKSGKTMKIKVDMGEPVLEGKNIPSTISKKQVVGEPLNIGGKKVEMTLVNMGNPHCVIFVNKVTDSLVHGIGPKIEKHPLFPKRINVEFITVRNRKEVDMRVWERGSGETLACGTGASAACVAGVLNALTDRKVTIHLLGGDLQLEWGTDNHVYMTGPAEMVFEGEIDI